MSNLIEFKVLHDGWIAIPAGDFQVGVRSEARLLIGLNQLLLRMSGRNILIDAGLGTKWQPSEIDLLAYETPRRLMPELDAAGVRADEIDIVVYTHLHYDHSGGGTRLAGKNLAPSFTNALYYVQKSELEFAKNPDPQRISDYKPADWNPLIKTGQLVELDGDKELLPGLKVFLAPGHSVGHQVVLAEDGDSAVFFPGDLFAARLHVNLDTIMSYDYDVENLLKNRSLWIQRARAGRWTCVFCHEIRDATAIL